MTRCIYISKDCNWKIERVSSRRGMKYGFLREKDAFAFHLPVIGQIFFRRIGFNMQAPPKFTLLGPDLKWLIRWEPWNSGDGIKFQIRGPNKSLWLPLIGCWGFGYIRHTPLT